MSSTSTTTSATATGTSGSGIHDLLNGNAGTAAALSGETFYTLLASIYTAAASFGIQFVVFVVLRMRLSRIYRPKSYLVAERERVPIPPSGIYQWIKPMLSTSNTTIIQRCGLDAYFFLRYLRMLLKMFIPMAAIIIPILLPINQLSGDGTNKGVNQLGWQNVTTAHTDRLWAHLILSLVAIAWILYVIYTELRGYIRIRQAYLTSPQHRLRASATTVLVSGIPRKWLTVEALNGLYDVFPGGIRNIWINRNFDELSEKVNERNSIASSLESAETSLIRKCVQKHKEAEQKKAKSEGKAKKTKAEKEQDRKDANAEAEDIAQGEGISSGDPHNIPHNIHEAVEEIGHDEHGRDPSTQRYFKDPLFKIGEGIGAFGQGIFNLPHAGKKFVGDMTDDVKGAIRNVNSTVDRTVEAANSGPGFGAGFVLDDSDYQTPLKPRPETPPTALSLTASGQRHVSENNKVTELQKSDDVAVLERNSPSYLSPAAPSIMASSPISTQSEAQSGSPVQYLSTSSAKPATHRKAQSGSNPSGVVAFLTKYKKGEPLEFPSPQPHTIEEDEFPLHDLGHPRHPDLAENPDQEMSKSKWAEKFGWLAFWRKKEEEDGQEETYPQAFNEEIAEDEDGEAVWKQYMSTNDRDTLREPLFKKSWFPRLPLVGKKIDKIYYLRKELARLNLEIEQDQQNVEKFPFMNSAFIQFNHQVAAHMACQSLSHHVPHHMTPRIVEISPSDVLWDNMSMKWWERYLRTAIGFALAVGLTIFYAIPVTFTGFLSQIDYIAELFPWLHWLTTLPKMAKAIIQGILPPVLLSVILTLIPIVFRLLVKQRGVPTGSDGERGVQIYYFVFLFIQVFLVVTLSTSLTDFFKEAADSTLKVPQLLAGNLPNASNYFFSYLTVQALNNSAGALLQVTSLLVWFFWSPIIDNTAREKWARQTKLKRVRWGSFFPPFTNFAVIGIVYSTIAPLIMVFNLIVFSIYWVTQRYNVLYVYQFRLDTGGLLFPTAVNQLFVGVYTLEICMVGLFFLRDNKAIPQAVIMIVALVFTALYQWLLNDAFRPLFRYLPITLEDDAVIRDEEFARAQHLRFSGLPVDGGDDIHSLLENQERHSSEEEKRAIEEERRRIRDYKRSSHNTRSFSPQASGPKGTGIMDTKPTKPSSGDRWRQVKNLSQPVANLRNMSNKPRRRSTSPPSRDQKMRHTATDVDPQSVHVDPESQQAVGDVLYSGFCDELEDLTPEERDALIRYSFQHSALRARRPVIWIPRDALGVSDDEIQRCKQMSTVEHIDSVTEKREMKTSIWISNEGTALDAKGRVVFRRSPPDFANVDLIAL